VGHVGSPLAAGTGKSHLFKEHLARVAAPARGVEWPDFYRKSGNLELWLLQGGYKQKLVLKCRDCYRLLKTTQQALEVLSAAGAGLV
jgi:hypothetical protein